MESRVIVSSCVLLDHTTRLYQSYFICLSVITDTPPHFLVYSHCNIYPLTK
uniref:Uncharacterized protein n=1 Tax=Arundo donax TaxID=35708 RepID=A0A0A9BEX5_ARUDO